MRTVEERLEKSTDEVKRTIEIVWSAYRSVLSKEGRLAYVSMAISSGLRLYEALAAEGITYEELKARNPKLLFEQIILPNITNGIAIAQDIASRLDEPVVAPAILEAKGQGWSQDEYMGMWLRMIEQSAGRMVMSDGWEYSNGGCEEYLLGLQMAHGLKTRCDITVEDRHGKLLPAHRGYRMIGEALHVLHDMGQKARTVAEVALHIPNIIIRKTVHHAARHPVNEEMFDAARLEPKLLTEIMPLLEADYGLKAEYQPMEYGKGFLRDITALPENLILTLEEIEEEDQEDA